MAVNTCSGSGSYRQVYDAVVKRRESCFLTGSAGTGKSFLLRVMLAGLRARDEASRGTVDITVFLTRLDCDHFLTCSSVSFTPPPALTPHRPAKRPLSCDWSLVLALRR